MTAAHNLIGRRFGRLVVTERAGSRLTKSLWRAKCDCGKTAMVPGHVLVRGSSNSCGCLKLEANITHGMAATRLYQVWCNMRLRCDNPNASHYKDYGGRGIGYDLAWRDAGTFIDWALANGYRDDLEIDRIDNEGDYRPANCRFVTRRENLCNRRNSRIVFFRGERMTITDLAVKSGMYATTLRRRIIDFGMDGDAAVDAGGTRCRKQS